MAQQLLAYDAALAERAAEARPPRVVSLAQIADVAAQIMAAPGALLENQREAFLLLARGEVSICPIQVALPVQRHARACSPSHSIPPFQSLSIVLSADLLGPSLYPSLSSVRASLPPSARPSLPPSVCPSLLPPSLSRAPSLPPSRSLSPSLGMLHVESLQTLGQPPLHQLQAGSDAQVCVKTGYAKGDDIFCVKIAGGGGDYGGNTGMMQVFSQRSLRLQCVIQDEGILTEMRTAAAACVASSRLMPHEVAAVGMVGASVQAIWQLRFLRGILPASTRRVIVRSRTQASAAAFRDKMLASPCDLDRGWDIQTYEEVQAQGVERPFAQCGLIHTASCARQAVIGLADLQAAPDGRRGPVHISAMGADSAGKQELRLDLVEAADVLVCDSLVQTRERGEFQHYFAAHSGSPPKQVVEIGSLLSSPEPVRRQQPGGGPDALLTIFDSSGVAVQDVCIAKLVSRMLQAT